MLSQEHHSLLWQSWRSSEKSSHCVIFNMINNLGVVEIFTVFGTPTDLRHIFCQTSVNIYCGDLVLLSAVIVNLPSLCLLTDESDPWPGGASGRGGGWHVVCVCVCACEQWPQNFCLEPQGHLYSPLSYYAKVRPTISLYPLHTLKKNSKPPKTQTHDHHHLVATG